MFKPAIDCSVKNYGEIFAKRLKEARKSKKSPLSQKDLAKIIDVTKTSMCNYEKGLLPSLKNTLNLADELGVSLDYLFGRIENEPVSLGKIVRYLLKFKNEYPNEVEVLEKFMREYEQYNNMLENSQNGTMKNMFESWLNSQLKELDSVLVE